MVAGFRGFLVRRGFRGSAERGINSQACATVAADFRARNRYLHIEIASDLLFQLLIEAAFKFADFAATEAGDMNMVARPVTFVVVAIAAQMQQIQFVDEALFLEQVDGAVYGNQVNAGINFLRTGEDLIDVQVLLGGVHDLQDDATLLGHAQTALG